MLPNIHSAKVDTLKRTVMKEILMILFNSASTSFKMYSHLNKSHHRFQVKIPKQRDVESNGQFFVG